MEHSGGNHLASCCLMPKNPQWLIAYLGRSKATNYRCPQQTTKGRSVGKR
ncbi:unnamed protein product [Musa acuminata subsp. burmannicoides]